MQELNYTSKILNPHFCDWIDSYIREKPLYPKIIELDVTSNCMYTCPECINSDLINKGGTFAEEKMDKLLREFGMLGVIGIIFIGGGEPLLYKGFGNAMKLCNSLGIATGVTTNGFLICDYLDELAHYSSWTRVSVDAATSATYDLIRPCKYPNAFGRVICNMQMLAENKKGKLGFSFLAIEQQNGFTNINEAFIEAKIARDIGCDYFELKPMVDKFHFLYNYSESTKKAILNTVEKLYELETETFHVIFPDSILKYKSETTYQPKSYKTCATCDLRAVVTPHGVYPCPYKRGNDSARYGYLDSSFKALWDNKMVKVDPSKECSFFCIRHDLNLFLELIKKDPMRYEAIKKCIVNSDDVFV